MKLVVTYGVLSGKRPRSFGYGSAAYKLHKSEGSVLLEPSSLGRIPVLATPDSTDVSSSDWFYGSAEDAIYAGIFKAPEHLRSGQFPHLGRTGDRPGECLGQAAVTGDNVVSLHGALNCELIGHPVKAILDDDIAGTIARYLSLTFDFPAII
jgi:hypothetical protein